MITSTQIRVCALLNRSKADLSKRSGIVQSALMPIESSHGSPSGNIKTFDALQKTFEEAGIEFIGSPEDGAGVRWKNKSSSI